MLAFDELLSLSFVVFMVCSDTGAAQLSRRQRARSSVEG
jgi:hypothetical protein